MGAKSWFEGVVESREEFELQEMPKYNRFVCHMDYIESDLYYDFGADYYFAVQNKLKTENMKKNKIRITESKLKQIVAESVKKVISELDLKTFPKGDYRQRNEWWKTQTNNDFPNFRGDSKDWQSTYNSLD